MEKFNLWPEGTAPLMLPEVPADCLENLEPTICYYPAENKITKATVVIYAGGGYSHRAKHEGEGYALYLNECGMDAFVVNYRVRPYRFPVELLDARRGVRFVRANAEKFGIDPTRVAVMGSSAGGHLAALVSAYRGEIDGEGVDEIDEICPIPDLQVLCYPVLDMEGHVGSYRALLGDNIKDWRQVTPRLIAGKDTPACFMWHCEGDKVVDVMNTLRYSMRLVELGVSQECHIYPHGSHGIGLVNEERFAAHTYMRSWYKQLLEWFKLNGFFD